MGFKIRFKQEALKQIDSLYQYIAGESPEAGRKIIERVHVVFKCLKVFPLIGKLTDESFVHCVTVVRTGLLIFYTFDTDTVTVVRILHERQQRN